MRLASLVTCAAALLSFSFEVLAADSTVYRDAETGFTFSQYNAEFAIGKYITYRIATPSGVSQSAPYDIVLQVAAPVAVGWAAISWGGTMLGNPLSVGWQNGASAIVSSRWASTRSQPVPYSGATFQTLRVGTHSNSTMWQYTAKCTGCTSWNSTWLNPSQTHLMAFGYAAAKPYSPSTNTSGFGVHDVANYWNHDFSVAQNSNFAALVAADT